MIQSYKSKANIGLLIGFWLSISAVGMRAQPDTRSTAAVMALTGWVTFVWGAVQYARAKGRSGWWGAFGVIGVLGMIPLLCLEDRAKAGLRLHSADERYLFPSDERVATRPSSGTVLLPGERGRVFAVQFGGLIAVDGFGFVRDGSVELAGNTLTYRGPRHWSLLARTGAFLVLAVGLFFLLNLLSIFVALALLHYFAASRSELALNAAQTQLLARDGRKVTLLAIDPQSGVRKTSVLRLETEEEAAQFGTLLADRPLAAAA